MDKMGKKSDKMDAKQSDKMEMEPEQQLQARGEGPQEDENVSVPNLDPGTVVTHKKPPGPFTVLNKLGEGGFGAVYRVRGIDKKTYAMKVEGRGENNDLVSVLKIEIRVLTAVHKDANIKDKARHFCQQYGRGRYEHCNYLVMTLLGPSLGDLRKERPQQRFTLATALRAGWQSLTGIEALHHVGYIHRDIKPSNFAIGKPEEDELRLIYMLDFGMGRLHIVNGVPRTPRDSVEFRGTTRYAPLACHAGKEMARKEDIEIWLYMLVEMIGGRLPWHSMREKDEVYECKKQAHTASPTKMELLKMVPLEVSGIMGYVDNLTYVDAPDYNWLRTVLSIPLNNMQLTMDSALPYDWEPDHDESKTAALAVGIRTYAEAARQRSRNGRARSARRSLRRPAALANMTPAPAEASGERQQLSAPPGAPQTASPKNRASTHPPPPPKGNSKKKHASKRR